MSCDYGTEGYYKKLIDLQEKLRKSEEERLQLEIKFNEMVQVTKDEKQNHFRHLRAQYNRFLEEDKKRQERNARIVRTLDRIDSRAQSLAAKTERFKILRKQYQILLHKAYNCKLPDQTLESLDFSDATSVREALISDQFGSKEKRDILQSYLRNSSSNVGSNVPFSIGLKPSNLDYLYSSSFGDGIQMDNNSTRIADDILNSIQRPGVYSKDNAHILARRNEMESERYADGIKTMYMDDTLAKAKQNFGKEPANISPATWRKDLFTGAHTTALDKNKYEKDEPGLKDRKHEGNEPLQNAELSEKADLSKEDVHKPRVSFYVPQGETPAVTNKEIIPKIESAQYTETPIVQNILSEKHEFQEDTHDNKLPRSHLLYDQTITSADNTSDLIEHHEKIDDDKNIAKQHNLEEKNIDESYQPPVQADTNILQKPISSNISGSKEFDEKIEASLNKEKAYPHEEKSPHSGIVSERDQIGDDSYPQHISVEPQTPEYSENNIAQNYESVENIVQPQIPIQQQVEYQEGQQFVDENLENADDQALYIQNTEEANYMKQELNTQQYTSGDQQHLQHSANDQKQYDDEQNKYEENNYSQQSINENQQQYSEEQYQQQSVDGPQEQYSEEQYQQQSVDGSQQQYSEEQYQQQAVDGLQQQYTEEQFQQQATDESQRQYSNEQYQQQTIDESQQQQQQQQYTEEQYQQQPTQQYTEEQYQQQPMNASQQQYNDAQYQQLVDGSQVQYTEEQYQQQPMDGSAQQYTEQQYQQQPVDGSEQQYTAEGFPQQPVEPVQQYSEEQYQEQYPQGSYVTGDEQQYVEGQYSGDQQQYIEGSYQQQNPNQQQYVEGQYQQQGGEVQFAEGQYQQQGDQQQYTEGQYEQPSEQPAYNQADGQQQQHYAEGGEYAYDSQQVEQTYNNEYSEETPEQPIPAEIPEAAAVDKKVPNFADMLETDTESSRQDTKVSNESDFDFSNK